MLTSVLGDHIACTFRAEVQSCFSMRHNNTTFEDKGKLFLQNFCIPLQDYMVSQTGRPKSEHSLTTTKTWNPVSVTFTHRQHFTLTLKLEILWSSETVVCVSYIKTVIPIIKVVCPYTMQWYCTEHGWRWLHFKISI